MTHNSAVGIPARLGVPRTPCAPAFRAGHVVRFFEYLTIAEPDLGSWQQQQKPRGPSHAVQWRCEYLPPARPYTPSPQERCALAVLEKLIHRGRVTTLSPSLEAAIRLDARKAPVLSSDTSADTVYLSKIDATDPGSIGEHEFWEQWLPELMGPDCWRWATPQIGLESLGVPDSEGGEERADFLICHPQLDSPIVIEIDGDHHYETTRQAKDEVRDQRIAKAGFLPIRIPAGQITAGGAALEKLKEILRPVLSSPRPISGLRSPYRRAGQIQLTLLETLRAGLISPSALGTTRVDSDVVAHGDMTRAQFQATIDDFRELVSQVGKLYALEWDGEPLSSAPSGVEGQQPDLFLAFHDSLIGQQVIHIDDVMLPFHFHHSIYPSGPGRIDSTDRELLRYFLQRVFRKQEFRDGQYEGITRVLAGLDTLVLLPTGSGKSLVFQLASLLLPGQTLVIEPIVALIRDQVVNLRHIGIDRALAITADSGGPSARQAAYSILAQGQALFYYVAPERLQIDSFRDSVRALANTIPVSMIVIDEAHCVSEWGHDFRTSYLRVADTARECCAHKEEPPPLIGLTGTASQAVLKDVQRELRILDRESVLTPSSFDRPELLFEIRTCNSKDKPAILRELLTETIPKKLGVSPENLSAPKGDKTECGLVFCLHRRGRFGAQPVSRDLKRIVPQARVDYYCGSDPEEDRTEEDWHKHKLRVEGKFKNNELTLLACTKAFGMGVDKENIRYSIHYGIPGSVEAFYQEAGRAGRKRDVSEPALCCLIVSAEQSLLAEQLLLGVPVTAPTDDGKERDDEDDVDRLLYFHSEAFPGISAELDELRRCLQALGRLGQAAARTLRFYGDERRMKLEKAVHRLCILGVVEDYTVDFSARHLDIRLAAASPADIGNHYIEYRAGYSALDANEAQTQIQQLLKEPPPHLEADFVLEVARLLLDFVYEQIEHGRRWAIWSMASYCLECANDPEEFRHRILSHLQVTEYAEVLEMALQDETGGLEVVAKALETTTTPEKAEEFRGQAARFLESYPDHPAVRFALASSELLCLKGSLHTAKEHLLTAIEMARERYGVGLVSIAKACGIVLDSVHRKDPMKADDLERALLEEYGSQEFATALVQFGSPEVCRLSAWYLLQPLITASIDLCVGDDSHA